MDYTYPITLNLQKMVQICATSVFQANHSALAMVRVFHVVFLTVITVLTDDLKQILLLVEDVWQASPKGGVYIV